ncbi:hypothetical protein AMEX_G30 [Astyanax mexicanus]|uniref:Uncharacterized protein n=1 Tax=Astyanax mexicanus TaxID=7994 RepID=A0A8T2MJ60_ASTMX|nr:hypothetical protein AMEX_G30 [Astyanax mexicanus]
MHILCVISVVGEVRFLRCVSGNTLGSDKEFIRKLKEGIPGLKDESNVEKCDFILVFCPVVSRAETNIEAALKKLQDLSGSKDAVLVVLHHTFDQEMTVADSSRSVNRENTLTVDCLFHEGRGLLQCYRNQEALEKVIRWEKIQNVPQTGSGGHMDPQQTPQILKSNNLNINSREKMKSFSNINMNSRGEMKLLGNLNKNSREKTKSFSNNNKNSREKTKSFSNNNKNSREKNKNSREKTKSFSNNNMNSREKTKSFSKNNTMN